MTREARAGPRRTAAPGRRPAAGSRQWPSRHARRQVSAERCALSDVVSQVVRRVLGQPESGACRHTLEIATRPLRAGVRLQQRPELSAVTGLKQVMNASRIPSPAGWLPDSQRMVVTTIGPGGSQVQTVDTQTGQVENQFLIENAKGGFARLSPDGKWLAFSEMTFGQANYGLYVARLDGSEKRLVAGVGDSAAAAGAWSADSQWLIVNVSTFSLGNDTETPVLVGLGTCQVFRLDKLAGRVTDWR